MGWSNLAVRSFIDNVLPTSSHKTEWVGEARKWDLWLTKVNRW